MKKLLIFLFYLINIGCQGFNVIRTPDFVGETVQDSFAIIKEPQEIETSSLSICLWVAQTDENKFEILSKLRIDGFSVRLDPHGNIINIDGVDIKFKYPSNYSFLPDHWIFFCVTFDNISKILSIFLNGQSILQKTVEHLPDYDIRRDFLKNQVFGKADSFAGRTSDINIWSSVLKNDQIEDLYECKETIVPDLFHWEASKLELGSGLTVEDELEPCIQNQNYDKSDFYVYPVQLTMKQKHLAIRTCEALGGEMLMPKTPDEMDGISKALNQSSASCKSKGFWLPMFKKNKEELWIDSHSRIVDVFKWKRGEPNADDGSENCATINTNMEYSDSRCDEEFCFYCRIVKFRIFNLKGICKHSYRPLDHQFVLRPDKLIGERPTWIGFRSDFIRWNSNAFVWELIDEDSQAVLAVMESDREFPIGENVWKIISNDACDDEKNGTEITFMLSKCDDGEFSCTDGSCIPIADKSDFIPDCWDGLDEGNFPLFSLKNIEGYEKDLPDIEYNQEHEEKDEEIKLKPINVSVDINNIESIQEVKARYTASLTLRISWYDSRLTWNDLNGDIFLNRPNEEQLDIFWTPEMVFSNSEQGTILPRDPKAKILVAMKGNFTMSDQFTLKETAFYKGSENPLVYSREFNMKFKCAFKLAFFPFDTQVCNIELNAGSNFRNFVQLVPEKLRFNGPTQLAAFYVRSCSMEMNPPTKNVDIMVKIKLKRRINQHLIQTYLPSLCIMTIAQVIKDI